MSIFYVKNHLNIFEYFFGLVEGGFLVTFFDNFSLKKGPFCPKVVTYTMKSQPKLFIDSATFGKISEGTLLCVTV